MMYLLTEAEYADLKTAKAEFTAASKAALQRVCTLAAIHTPVSQPWRGDTTSAPWGCILESKDNPGYCDHCPVSRECPHTPKKWSK